MAIIGGGIAGLWSGVRLARAGYGVALLEAAHLGGNQTLASQGMIHGGVKYTLDGALTDASEAIAQMPQRWRRCLAGDGEIDLREVTIRSRCYNMFASAGVRNRLTGFLASHALRDRVRTLRADDRPDVFDGFTGQVYELDDIVLDARSLCAVLAGQPGLDVYCSDVAIEEGSDTDETFRLRAGRQRIQAKAIIAAAGIGNETLIAQAGLSDLATQRRPLCQVIVHSAETPLPQLYAHCLTGITSNEPRLTITSHGESLKRTWYIGGRLASEGAQLADDEVLALARRELAECLPWLDLRDNPLTLLRVDRAEPARPRGRRPDTATVETRSNLVIAWPSKLTLAPDLGDKVVSAVTALTEPTGRCDALSLPRPAVGEQPW